MKLSECLHDATMFPPNSYVALTGQFSLQDPKAWIQAQGATPIIWSSRCTHLFIGKQHRDCWKLQQAKAAKIRLVYEAELPPPPKDLWVDTFAPKELKDVIGHAQTIKDLQVWLRSWPAKGRAALLTGPPGIGKTTVAHLLAKAEGFQVVEMNASDERSAKSLRESLEKFAKSTTLSLGPKAAKRLVILDEVDGMSAGDRGGVAEITRIIREGCSFPLVCLANERSQKLKGLTGVCLDVRFTRPQKGTIAKAIAAKLKGQKGMEKMDVRSLEDLCERNGNDIRSMLNSLQFSSLSHSEKDDIHQIDAFDATRRLFGTVASLGDREAAAFVDHSMVPLLVQEAYLGAAEKCRGSDGLAAAAAAADRIGDWDLLDTRINRSQAWGLLPAAMMSVVAAAKAANGPPPWQFFPSWLGKNSKKLKHRRLLQDMRARMDATDPHLMDTRNILRTTLFDTSKSVGDIVATLDEMGLTRDDMLETLVETTMKGDDAEVAMETKKKSALTREWKKTHPEPKGVKQSTTDEDLEYVSDDE
jgi:replication factor C subunit 1